MTNRRDYHDRTPHFDGSKEGAINAPEGPKMGIKIDVDPQKKQNPNPFHLSDDSKKGIDGFSNIFEDKEPEQ